MTFRTRSKISLFIFCRTEAPPVARDMLTFLDWNRYLTYQEIYPGRKTTHFQNIKNESGVDYKDMLFFDDEYRNIRDLSAVGVTCVFVEEPMSSDLMQRGLTMFKEGITHK